MAGLCGLNNLVPYCATKFAVRGLMEGLTEEIRETQNSLVCLIHCTYWKFSDFKV